MIKKTIKIKITESSRSIFFALVISSLIVPIFLPFNGSWLPKEVKDVLLSIIQPLVLSIIFFVLIWKKKASLKIYRFDLCLFLFIIIGFCSYSWALNGSLIWHHAFTWLQVILWLFLIRYVAVKNEVNHSLFLIFFFFCLYNFAYSIPSLLYVDYANNYDWTHYFGFNKNMVTLILCSYFPFLLFYPLNGKTGIIAKGLITIFLAYLISKADSRGSMLFFVLSLSSYLLSVLNKKNDNAKSFFQHLIIGAFGVTLLGYFFLTGAVSSWTEESFLFDPNRYVLNINSIKLLLDNPLLGIGLGNWHLEAYTYGVSDTYNQQSSFYRTGNHNLYSQHLAELGILGFAFFGYPILRILYQGFQNFRQAEDFQKAIFTATLICFLSFFIYRDAFFYDYHYGNILLFAFCLLGLIKTDDQLTILPRWSILVGMTLSLVCAGWFIYALHTDRVYKEANRLKKSNPKSIFLLNDIYHPIFKTTNGFKDVSQSFNNIIAFDIAKRLAILEQTNPTNQIVWVDTLKEGAIDSLQLTSLLKGSSTEKYFKLALQDSSNEDFVLLQYAKFLLQSQGRLAEAKHIAKTLYSKYEHNCAISLLLAEIAIAEEKYTSATHFLNTRYIDREVNYLLLEIKLFNARYLGNILQLSTDTIKNISTQLIPFYQKSDTLLSQKQKDSAVMFQRALEQLTYQRDLLLFNELNESQFKIVRQLTAASIYGKDFLTFNLRTNTSENQKQLLEELLSNYVANKYYVRFLSRRMKQAGALSSHQALEKKLLLLRSNLDKEFEQILSKEQMQIYRLLHKQFPLFVHF
ncbi:MAG: O-antigen ligase family protein [Saprospiraceae bacterium]